MLAEIHEFLGKYFGDFLTGTDGKSYEFCRL